MNECDLGAYPVFNAEPSRAFIASKGRPLGVDCHLFVGDGPNLGVRSSFELLCALPLLQSYVP